MNYNNIVITSSMEDIMNVTLRKVGNSHAVIIPKTILSQLGLENQLDMQVIDNQIILRKPRKVRQGWEDAAQAIARAGDDTLRLDDDIDKLEDGDEWIW